MSGTQGPHARGAGRSAPDWTRRTKRSAAHEALVADAVRSVGRGTEALSAGFLVCLEVALEPRHLRIPFEGEHVCRDAVQEPAIVGDHHGTAREREQCFLQSAQRVHVKIVRRLVQQQQVAAGAQQLGKVHAIALTAGELADAGLLVGALEVEAGGVLA